MDTEAKRAVPLIVWIAIVAGILLLFWGSGSFLLDQGVLSRKSGPFYKVTNRDFSLFLWNHSDVYRADIRQFHEMALTNEMAKRDVKASPQVLAEYHVWKRLLGSMVIPRQIPLPEFRNFLAYAFEWLPENWEKAPSEYKAFVDDLPSCPFQQLEPLPEETIPLEVRMAFYGWKNTFYEREAIRAFQPDVKMIESFLSKYPQFARHNFRNFYPDYLLSLNLKGERLPYFFRSALYNAMQVDQERSELNSSPQTQALPSDALSQWEGCL